MNARRILILAMVVLAFILNTQAQRSATMRNPVDLRVQVRLIGGGLEPRGVLVRLQAEQMPGGQTLQNTDTLGKTVFIGLPQAIYTVTAEMPGYITQTQTIDLQNSASGYVVMELKKKPDANAGLVVPPEGPYATIAANISPEAKEQFAEGQKRLEKSDAAGSIDRFKKAVEIAPTYTDAYLALGTAYLDTGDYANAEKALEKAVELEPKLPSARFALGAAYNRSKDYQKAEQHLRAGLQLNKGVADGHYELARVLIATGRGAEGEEEVRKALTVDYKHAPSYVVLGNALLARRDTKGALECYQEYLKLAPNGPLAPATKEMVAKLEKDVKKAK